MGHVLYCAECNENYWSAMGQMQPGDPCRVCGAELQLDRRESLEAPPTDDRRDRAPITATT
jgi:rRNA maturation endonuclease Nob1